MLLNLVLKDSKYRIFAATCRVFTLPEEVKYIGEDGGVGGEEILNKRVNSIITNTRGVASHQECC